MAQPPRQTVQTSASEGKTTGIVRVTTQPVIDGVIDDAVWSQATPITDLHQVNPVEYAEPSERTEIRLLYDDDTLYIAARLWDSQPGRITAQVLRQGEGLENEDRFAIILDPHLDRRSGYRFQVNANGVRWDALYADTSNVQSDWEGIWRGEATIDAEGWSAEMAIPFKTLSFDPGSDSWGINFERTIQRNDESLAWVSRNRQLNPGVAGTVVGFRDLQQGRGLDIVPSASARGRQSYGATAASSSDFEPSLDIFYKITPSLNGALTLNTDFSSTEIDDRQVNLTRFSLFFPEKRDFFLQDADIFQFGRIGGGGNRNFRGPGGGGGSGFGGGGDNNGMPFFSRTLGLSPDGQEVDIEVGAKLSGRVGRWNIGMLSVRQGDYMLGAEHIAAGDIIIGRISANVLGESNVGVIFTDGDPRSNNSASTFGTDFNYRNTRLPGNKVLEANAWVQETDEPGIIDNNKAYGFGIGSPNSTGLRGDISARHIEENFDPAVGFVNETGIETLSGELAYRWRFGNSRLRNINLGTRTSRTELLATGELDRQDSRVQFSIGTANQDNLFMAYSMNKENIPFDFPIYRPSDGSPPVIITQGSYSWDTLSIGMRTGEQRKVAAFMSYTTGDYYDGTSKNINSNVAWRPSRRLSISGGYGFRDATLPSGDFQVRQTDLSVQFVFSSTLSWVNRIQYDNFSEVVGFNSRLHWIPEAGREGYIVFNHNVSDPDKNDAFHSVSADMSIKFSYTFRF